MTCLVQFIIKTKKDILIKNTIKRFLNKFPSIVLTIAQLYWQYSMSISVFTIN